MYGYITAYVQLLVESMAVVRIGILVVGQCHVRHTNAASGDSVRAILCTF